MAVEWYQLYRYDVATGDVTLLTDGKSRNLAGPWSSSGDQVAYMSRGAREEIRICG